MTDLPFGRGGSPLQNLLVRGIHETKLSAFRIGKDMDAGAVYLKRSLSLDGNAEEIYLRASRLAFDMIDEILAGGVTSAPQVGDAVLFRRRAPAESEVPAGLTLEQLFDFIRMLDAEGYPRAFVRSGGFRYEFSRASLEDETVRANVRISREPETSQ